MHGVWGGIGFLPYVANDYLELGLQLVEDL